MHALSQQKEGDTSCNNSGLTVSAEVAMHEYPNRIELSVYCPSGARKYLNAAERQRFAKAAGRANADDRHLSRQFGGPGIHKSL